jgi:hypothetical protein
MAIDQAVLAGWAAGAAAQRGGDSGVAGQAQDADGQLALTLRITDLGRGAGGELEGQAMRPPRDPDRWDAVARSLPLIAHWLDGIPIDDGMAVLAGLEDRYRGFADGGTPVATGVVAVADSWACSSPANGRDASIGLLHAGPCGTSSAPSAWMTRPPSGKTRNAPAPSSTSGSCWTTPARCSPARIWPTFR